MARPALETRNRQIIAAVQSGKTFSEVADQLGLSRNAVAGVCHRAGVKGVGPAIFDTDGARLASQTYWSKPGVRLRHSERAKAWWRKWREDRA